MNEVGHASTRLALTLEKRPVSIVRAMLAAGVAVPEEIMAAARKVHREYVQESRRKFYARGMTREGRLRRQPVVGQAKSRAEYMRAWRKVRFLDKGLTTEGKPRRYRKTGIQAETKQEYHKIYNALFS